MNTGHDATKETHNKTKNVNIKKINKNISRFIQIFKQKTLKSII